MLLTFQLHSGFWSSFCRWSLYLSRANLLKVKGPNLSVLLESSKGLKGITDFLLTSFEDVSSVLSGTFGVWSSGTMDLTSSTGSLFSFGGSSGLTGSSSATDSLETCLTSGTSSALLGSSVTSGTDSRLYSTFVSSEGFGPSVTSEALGMTGGRTTPYRVLVSVSTGICSEVAFLIA